MERARVTLNLTANASRVIRLYHLSCSVMYAGNAVNPMVVYKTAESYPEWEQNGVTGALYSATESGWFNMVTFEEWFNKVL